MSSPHQHRNFLLNLARQNVHSCTGLSHLLQSILGWFEIQSSPPESCGADWHIASLYLSIVNTTMIFSSFCFFEWGMFPQSRTGLFKKNIYIALGFSKYMKSDISLVNPFSIRKFIAVDIQKIFAVDIQERCCPM